MEQLMARVYWGLVSLYHGFIRLAGLLGHPKAKLWAQGRKDWRRIIAKGPSPFPAQRVVWMHVASLGEFEQGRPLLERIRHQWPDAFICLTFYSPSGFEIRKDYTGADRVLYLPPDSPANARDFISWLRPNWAIFVKYDLWYFHIQAAHQAGACILLTSARIPKHHAFISGVSGVFYRSTLRRLAQIFVQDPLSEQHLRAKGLDRIRLAGDTRFDRVAALSTVCLQQPTPLQATLLHWTQHPQVLVAGSTWPRDEALIHEALQLPDLAGYRVLVVPHDLSEARLAAWRRQWGDQLLSWHELQAGQTLTPQHRIVWVDTVGWLSRLYALGSIAYVGGGHNRGIHNVLEPATFGIPVLFGPKHKRWPEAQALIDLGAGAEIRNADDLAECLGPKAPKHAELTQKGKLAAQWVRDNTGAVHTIWNWMDQHSA